MAQNFRYVTIVGVEATPIALGANGSASDVWTWTHNLGYKAQKVEILDAVTRQPVAANQQVVGVLLIGLTVSVITNSTTVLAIQNQSTIAQNVILEITWDYLTAQIGAPILASVGTLA